MIMENISLENTYLSSYKAEDDDEDGDETRGA